MQPRISVVVPVYNAEQYLFTALGNLAAQTMLRTEPAMEIILVNDASTDRSLLILEKFRAQFPEMTKIIDCEENHGAGGARNLGIDAARGEYVGFMDCDDLVHPTMYEKLYRAAVSEGNADFADCAVHVGMSDANMLYTHPDCQGALDDAKRARLIAAPGFIWSRIFKRELLARHQIRFRAHRILEDIDFLSLCFAAAKRAACVQEVLYDYVDVPGSYSKRTAEQDPARDTIDVVRALHERLSPLPNYMGIRDGVVFSALVETVRCLHGIDGLRRDGILTGLKAKAAEASLREALSPYLTEAGETDGRALLKENRFVAEMMGDEMRVRLERFFAR